MRPRAQLQALLSDILGSEYVYFQPPESVKMQYPAIIYETAKMNTIHADNRAYHFVRAFTVTFVTYDANPDSEVNSKLRELPLCQYDRHYLADNLHHYVYSLYF
jgi:hypothetical protein